MQNVVSLCKYKHPKQKSSCVLTGYLLPLASVCILLTAFNPGAGIVHISGNLTPVCRWHSTSDHSKSRNRSERREIRKYKQKLNNKTSMHGMGKLTQNSDARARLIENPPPLGHPHDVLTVRPPCFYGLIFSINCNTVRERWREPASLFSWCWPNCKETHPKRKKKMIVRLHKAPRLPGRFSFTGGSHTVRGEHGSWRPVSQSFVKNTSRSDWAQRSWEEFRWPLKPQPRPSAAFWWDLAVERRWLCQLA